VTTAIDSNVLIALWDVDDALNREAQAALDQALAHGKLVVPAPVFAELLAFPQRTEGFLQAFFARLVSLLAGNFRKMSGRRPDGLSESTRRGGGGVVSRDGGGCWWIL